MREVYQVISTSEGGVPSNSYNAVITVGRAYDIYIVNSSEVKLLLTAGDMEKVNVKELFYSFVIFFWFKVIMAST